MTIGAIFAAIYLLSGKPPTQSVASETYRLVFALGNTERIVSKGLDKQECEKQKAELKIVATSLGTYNEAAGIGSITCLPESFFAN